LILAGLLGLLLGGGAVVFFGWIYNPFMDRIDSPLVLIPESADFVLSIPDFPDFLGQLRDRPFVDSLGEHEGFQQFLKTKSARDTGIVDTLRQAFAQLDEIGTSLPMGLDLLGDVSGAHVLICGYLPDRTSGTGDAVITSANSDEDVRFMLAFQPQSWKALAGVNILLDETLCGWFIKDPVEAQGVEIDHMRDLVRLRLPAPAPKRGASPAELRKSAKRRDLWITRIADTVLVSTEERELARIFNFVAKKGIPATTAARYTPLLNAYGGFQAHLLCRREKVDRFMKLEEQLTDQWGAETLEFAESTLPRLGGEDMVVELDINRGFGMALGGRVGEDIVGDLAPLLRRFNRTEFRADFDELTRFLPDDVFSVVRLAAPLGKVLGMLAERDNFMSPADRKDMRNEMAKIPAFGDWDRLMLALSDYTRPSINVAFFRQPREALDDKAEAGFALVCPLRNPAGVTELINGLDKHVRGTQGEGLIKQIYREKDGDTRLYKIELVSGAVDDPRVTVPGVAIAHGHLVFSNYFDFLRKIPGVIKNDGKVKPMGGSGFDVAMAYMPREMLLGAIIDGSSLEPYLDQSANGWAYGKTNPSQARMGEWRSEAKRLAIRRGLDPVSIDGGNWIDTEVRRRIRHMTEVERPEALRSHRETIDQFRGLIQGFGFYVEATTGGVRMSVRVEPHKAKKN